MATVSLAPSEQVAIIFALSKLLGVALLQGNVEIYCSPQLTLSLSPTQIRALIGKVEGLPILSKASGDSL